MESQTLKTVIEFVSSGTGGGTGAGDAAATAGATGSSATADPLFTIIAVLIAIAAIGISLFVYARRNKLANANALAAHARPSINSQGLYGNNLARRTKYLIATICIIVVATCFAIFGHNNALATEGSATNGDIATITDKVQANVDDAGAVTFDKGVIKNNDKVLAIGVRHVAADTDVDLSDATLQITCNDEELYNKPLSEKSQLNDEYVTVDVDNSADLNYSIKMPADKAKQLVGTQPITLNTDVDLVVSKDGTVKDASGNSVKDAKVTYSYTDPYDQTKLVTGETKTGDNGEYTIPDIKKGSIVTVEISYKVGDREYYIKPNPISFDEETTPIDPVVPKTEPCADDFEFTSPGGGSGIIYDGSAKEATFTKKETPAGMGNITLIEYSNDGGKTWKTEAKDAGTYQVRINVSAGTGTTKIDGLSSDKWTFTINKAKIAVTPGSGQNKTYDGKIAQPTYAYDKPVSTETPAFEGNLGLEDNAVNAGTYDIVQNTLAPKNNGAFIAANYEIALPTTAVTYEIKKATITVTPTTDQSKKYDGSTASGITYGFTGAVEGETPAFTGALKLEGDPTPVNAGTYNIVNDNLTLNDGTGFIASNYTLTVVETVKYTINQATITVEPTAGQSKKYDGSTASDITYSSSGAIEGETPAFTGALKLDGDPAPVDAGTYNIVNDNLTLIDGTGFKASNYALQLSSTVVTYTINKASNNMQFELTTTAATSYYSATSDASKVIEAATDAPTSEGDKVTYKVTNLSSSGTFEISVDSSGTPSVVCKAGTPEGTYNLVVQAISGGKNYEAKTLPASAETSNFTWTMNKALKQATNVPYTNSSGGTQSINFVPAYPDTDSGSTYLKDNGVKFYLDECGTTEDGDINTLIDSGCNMNDFCGKLKDSTGKVKTLYVKANPNVKFYGTLGESWDNTFENLKSAGTASGYNKNEKLYEFLNDAKGIGTVYFDGSKNNPTISTEGNWTSGSGNCPTLNGVNYSNSDVGKSTFYEVYGPNGGKILSGSSPWGVWTPVRVDANNARFWSVADGGEWLDYLAYDDYYVVIVTLDFATRYSVDLQGDNGVNQFTDKNGNPLDTTQSIKEGETLQFKVDCKHGFGTPVVTCKIGSGEQKTLTPDENGVYTTDAISADSKVNVTTTEKTKYNVTLSKDTGVTKFTDASGETLESTVQVYQDDPLSFKVVCDDSHVVDTATCTIGGGAATTLTPDASGLYTTDPITAASSVNVSTKVPYSVTLNEATGVTNYTDLSGNVLTSPVKVADGETLSFKVVCEDSYAVNTVTCQIGSGETKTLPYNVSDTYTTDPITASASISTTTFEQTMKQVTNIEFYNEQQTIKINFVPSFADASTSFIKDNRVKYYTNETCTTEDTEINELIYSNEGCTMNQLYQKLLYDGTVKNLWIKANKGLTFFSLASLRQWDLAFLLESPLKGPAKNYNTSASLYKSFLDDTKGFGTVYFTGPKESPTVSTEGNWTTGSGDCPTLNGVAVSNRSNGTSTFYEAYGGIASSIHSLKSQNVWTSNLRNGQRAYSWSMGTNSFYDEEINFFNNLVLTLTF